MPPFSYPATILTYTLICRRRLRVPDSQVRSGIGQPAGGTGRIGGRFPRDRQQQDARRSLLGVQGAALS